MGDQSEKELNISDLHAEQHHKLPGSVTVPSIPCACCRSRGVLSDQVAPAVIPAEPFKSVPVSVDVPTAVARASAVVGDLAAVPAVSGGDVPASLLPRGVDMRQLIRSGETLFMAQGRMYKHLWFVVEV